MRETWDHRVAAKKFNDKLDQANRENKLPIAKLAAKIVKEEVTAFRHFERHYGWQQFVNRNRLTFTGTTDDGQCGVARGEIRRVHGRWVAIPARDVPVVPLADFWVAALKGDI